MSALNLYFHAETIDELAPQTAEIVIQCPVEDQAALLVIGVFGRHQPEIG